MTGIGLSRFAYAPLLPAIVQAGLLSGGAAGVLGALNLGGYLCGAFAAQRVGRALGIVWALRLAMVTASVCFALCAVPGGLAWLAPWRVLTGAAGGVLMILAGPAVQAVVPASMRGLAAGLVFTGVGGGIIVGAALVPVMLPHGIAAAWLALAGLATGLTVLSWRLWPDVPAGAAPLLPRLSGGAGWMVASYACAAMAQVVHMVWWPDFIARGLGRGTAGAAAFWMLYGASALIGPTVYGGVADRIGARRALRIAMAVQVVALALPWVSTATGALVLSAGLAGGTAIGSTALTLARAREMAGAEAGGIWRVNTVAFGLAQTATGFGLAWLYAATGGHAALFAFGTAAAVAAFVLSLR